MLRINIEYSKKLEGDRIWTAYLIAPLDTWSIFPTYCCNAMLIVISPPYSG